MSLVDSECYAALCAAGVAPERALQLCTRQPDPRLVIFELSRHVARLEQDVRGYGTLLLAVGLGNLLLTLLVIVTLMLS